MHYIVALGNPGDEYTYSRHNAGWLVLNKIIETEALPAVVFSGKYQSRITEGVIAEESVICAFPDTYMNHSGAAVKRLVPKDALEALIVLYDDIALSLGEIKISIGRGHGGHNGLRSIIEQTGNTDFVRIRIGIAQKSIFTGAIKRPTGEKLPKFVLANFTKTELQKLDAVASLAHEALRVIIKKGPAAAMNTYN